MRALFWWLLAAFTLLACREDVSSVATPHPDPPTVSPEQRLPGPPAGSDSSAIPPQALPAASLVREAPEASAQGIPEEPEASGALPAPDAESNSPPTPALLETVFECPLAYAVPLLFVITNEAPVRNIFVPANTFSILCVPPQILSNPHTQFTSFLGLTNYRMGFGYMRVCMYGVCKIS